jgi:hypothetical protein
MRQLIFAPMLFLLTGCLSPQVGMTTEEYQSQCKAATWKNATSRSLSTGETIMNCADSDLQVFDAEGVLRRLVSRDEAFVMIEHDKCLQFGNPEGTSDYVQCRVMLAQSRTQQEAIERQQQQQAAEAIRTYRATVEIQSKSR